MCASTVELTEARPWRCPRATLDDRHHVLHAAVVDAGAPVEPGDGPTPFHQYDRHLAWAASAAARGLSHDDRMRLVTELDGAAEAVAGVGFHETPFARSDLLSDALGFRSGGGIWVKDETGNVAGSQKARHLATILLHLRADEALGERRRADRAPLAIASCGNAALAAATLARSADWPIDVFVPTWMSDGFGDELDRLGARIHRCERRSDDPAGDPAMLRFRDAVADGAVPFTVQGPENALCLDGGRTIGWEIAAASTQAGMTLDALFVQVGGGAFAACTGAGLIGAGQGSVQLHAVQAAGCAPLAEAWRRGADGRSRWGEVMTPWESPTSLADGILDDETYDWIGVLDAVGATGGDVVVAAEERIERAWNLAVDAGAAVSPTGSAGLAGVLERLDGPDGDTWRTRRVGVVFSGVRR